MATRASAADINVFVTSAAQRPYEALVPEFERAGGHRLVNQFALPPELIRKMEAGEPLDVIILSYDVEGLIRQGKLVADSRTVLGRTGVGVAIRKGAPRPDFTTVEAFKRSLLGAKAIGTSGEGSSGRFFIGLLDRLGIADQVRPKVHAAGPKGTGKLLTDGEVDFAVTGLTPLVGMPDIEWLGNIPAEIQAWIVFTGGLNTRAREPAAGRALLNFLTSPTAIAAFKANGIEQVTPATDRP